MTHVFFAVVNADGCILSAGRCHPISFEAQAWEGTVVVETQTQLDANLDWFPDGENHAVRPTLAFDKVVIAANGVDVATLSGLPNPTTVYVDGTPYVVEDGVLEIASPMPATYRVSIPEAFPFLPFEAEIVAS